MLQRTATFLEIVAQFATVIAHIKSTFFLPHRCVFVLQVYCYNTRMNYERSIVVALVLFILILQDYLYK